jgi:RNA polymerase sigma-70 factor (ECF subfamily)
MRNALDSVSRRTRDVFFMQRLDGLSYAQIAERLSISVSAVEKHIASALAILANADHTE